MKSQDIHRYLIILSVLCLVSCNKKTGFEYSEIQQKEISDFDPGYNSYCHLDLNSNFELNAVECSFYGDFQNSLDQATKRKSVSNEPFENIYFGPGNNADLINSLETLLQNNEADESEKAEAKNMLNLLNTPNAKELIGEAKPLLAIGFIIDKAKDYHFTLINEAHFNSQHRSFTNSLLKPLWGQGYRYLALETLSHKDSAIYERGYPVKSTGYYTKDSNFGNLVREALEIGYRLIPYETENGYGGTLRDRDQAQNIYKKTFKSDKKGKVLVHAGYSHISETGDSNYEPMGYQLKKLITQDLLTIDQVEMIGYNDTAKQHDYYTEAVERFGFEEPTIFLTKEDRVIIDPVNSFSIDIQVFHPETKFRNGRPDWMYKKSIKSIPLSEELQEYKDNLIQAVKRGEAMDAVPVDQFVISERKVLLLPSGKFDLRLVNCNGDMIAMTELEVY